MESTSIASMVTVEQVCEINAPRETVFAVLTDHASYDKILAPVREATLEREGEGNPNGVGAIRALKIAGPALREEILTFEEPSTMSYSVISGAPVKKHLGTVNLEEAGDRTRMTYRIDITPYGPSFLAKPIVTKVVSDLVSGITRISEQRSTS